jgi:hypothetical protein
MSIFFIRFSQGKVTPRLRAREAKSPVAGVKKPRGPGEGCFGEEKLKERPTSCQLKKSIETKIKCGLWFDFSLNF